MRPSMVFGLGLVILAGCGSSEAVIFEETFDLPLTGRPFEIKVSPGKQNIKHRIMAPASSPISVFVYLAGEDEAAKKDIDEGHITARILAHQKETEKADFDVSLPPDSSAIVFIRRAGKATGKATNVRLKITTKK